MEVGDEVVEVEEVEVGDEVLEEVVEGEAGERCVRVEDFMWTLDAKESLRDVAAKK